MVERMIGVTATGLVVLLAACGPVAPGMASGTPSGVTGSEVHLDRAEPSTLTFRTATANELWRVMPSVFQGLGISAGVIDARSRIYGSPDVRLSSIGGQRVLSMFRCTNEGTGMASTTQYRVEFGIAVQPRPAGSGAELIVDVQAMGRLTDPSRSGTIHCVSNGVLEGMLKERLDAALL
ncbi:MAG TPA: hypothetical protein VK912_13855 [Longimicrobiales bacterium]|nr:hypothetical protein [Longimicrobiales bacterium]